MCALMKKENAFQKCPQIYLSISEVNAKAEVCKNSKRQKRIQCHMSKFFTQRVYSHSQIF